MKLFLGLTCSLLSSQLIAASYFFDEVDVYLASEIKAGYDVIVVDGKLTNMADELTAPDGASIIRGGSVTPALFNSYTHLGIEEVSAIESTVDYESTNADFTAALQVTDAFNPRSIVLRHNATMGLGYGLVVPESGVGLFAGQAAIVNTVGDIINPAAAMVVSLGEYGKELAGGSRASSIAMFRAALADAKHYKDNQSQANAGEGPEYSLSLADLKALLPVIKGKMPLIVKVQREDEIRRVLDLAKQYSIDIILAGATEAWRLGDDIAGIKVIIDPINNLPISFETLSARLDQATLLQASGATILFTGMGWQNTHNAFLVRQSAGNAVANGLPKLDAIASMSYTVSDVFKLPQPLTINNEASLVVWSGDPLDVTSEALLVFVDGQEIPFDSRAIRLRDRYFQRLSAAQE